MKFLYVLCEGERDDVFYERICERATGISFERAREFRYRPGANFKTVAKLAKILLNSLKHWRGQQDVGVVIALDNDRAPGHPGSVPLSRPFTNFDRRKPPRYPALKEMAVDFLGADRTVWPVDLALAVPVEMIESWVLLLWNQKRGELPLFAQANQKSAREHYGPNVTPQLKDLCEAEASRENEGDLLEFFWAAAEKDLDAAAAVSPSFRMFLEELSQWRH